MAPPPARSEDEAAGQGEDLRVAGAVLHWPEGGVPVLSQAEGAPGGPAQARARAGTAAVGEARARGEEAVVVDGGVEGGGAGVVSGNQGVREWANLKERQEILRFEPQKKIKIIKHKFNVLGAGAVELRRAREDGVVGKGVAGAAALKTTAAAAAEAAIW